MLIANVYPMSKKHGWLGLFLLNSNFFVISRYVILENITEPISLDAAHRSIGSLWRIMVLVLQNKIMSR